MRTITENDFRRAKAADAYWSGRWGCTGEACRILRGFPAESLALEIGPHTLPVVPGSDVMDIRPRAETSGTTFRHDAGVCPWPMSDGRYDVAVALQVWEHLGGAQREAFAELRRMADAAILSVPHRWPADKGDHGLIDESVVRYWSGGQEPNEIHVVARHLRGALWHRAVYYWQFRI